MDQGIIKNLKVHYRKSWLQHMLLGPTFGPSNQPSDWTEAAHLQQLAETLAKEGAIKKAMDINNLINMPEETIIDSPEDLIDQIAATFSEVDDPDDAVEQQEIQPVPVSEALKAVNLLLRFEEQQEDVSLSMLAQLRISRRRITEASLRKDLNAEQKTLDRYFRRAGSSEE
ncbi:hypothetical protein F4861DRAFT_534844 [Xylaria intraflava]|nr:hypothetical protein F4861DRAFT_534844 [Xylaria intraflava]